MEKNLTIGSPSRVVWKYALPVIGGNLFQLFYTMTDSIIVGHTVGVDALAAVGATSIIVYFILCFVQGVTGGFGIVQGQFWGAKDLTKLKKSIVSSLHLSLAMTVLIMLASCLLGHRIIQWMNTPYDISVMSYDYTIIIFMGTGATVFYNWISNLLRALGDSKMPLIFLIISSLLNIVLDLIFLVPMQMGVAGAAIATVLSQLISGILCTIFAFKHYEALSLSKEDWLFDQRITLKNLSMGLPMGLQMSVMCIGLIVMQVSINDLGTAAITGYTAANRVDQMSVLVNTAMGIAISNYVAQNYGALRFDRIKQGVFYCVLYTEIINVAIGLLMFVVKPWIVPLFVSNPTAEIASYASAYLNIVIPFYLLLGPLVIYRAAVQSMNNALIPFIACIIELILRTVCTLISARYFGYQAICFSIPLAWIGAGTLVTTSYFLMMHRFNEDGITKLEPLFLTEK